MVNTVDSICSGSALFAQSYLSKYLKSFCYTFSLRALALYSSPLCATAMRPCNVSTTIGWTFDISEQPNVEYLV